MKESTTEERAQACANLMGESWTHTITTYADGRIGPRRSHMAVFGALINRTAK